MNVIRYSFSGFKPQYQSYHLKQVEYYLNNFNLLDYPEHLQYEVCKKHNQKVKLFLEHYNDFRYGIWCFINGYKNNQSLNHLNRRVSCWIAELPNDTEGYDCNWDKLITLEDSIVTYAGIYIPERELYKLKHIKKVK